MTRLRFLLLSFFSSVASVFAMKPDREAMARAWLEANGFTYSDRRAATGFSRIIWYHRAIPYGAFHLHTDRVDGVLFMRLLDRRDFVVKEKHFHCEIVSFSSDKQEEGGSIPFGFKEVEDAPPTMHRFTRPDWL